MCQQGLYSKPDGFLQQALGGEEGLFHFVLFFFSQELP